MTPADGPTARPDWEAMREPSHKTWPPEPPAGLTSDEILDIADQHRMDGHHAVKIFGFARAVIAAAQERRAEGQRPGWVPGDAEPGEPDATEGGEE